MILSIGQELPSAYLDRFVPADGIPTRISVLSVDCVAIESHYMDFPQYDVRGYYQCTMGTCCEAMGIRRQSYVLPVFVYKAPNSTEGTLQMWTLAKTLWRKISELQEQAKEAGASLLDYDLIVTTHKQGQGTRTDVTFPPGQACFTYRTKFNEEQLKDLEDGVEYFFKSSEYAMAKPMTNQEWNQLLTSVGYDVVGGGWMNQPQRLPPAQAKGQISGAVQGGQNQRRLQSPMQGVNGSGGKSTPKPVSTPKAPPTPNVPQSATEEAQNEAPAPPTPPIPPAPPTPSVPTSAVQVGNANDLVDDGEEIDDSELDSLLED